MTGPRGRWWSWLPVCAAVACVATSLVGVVLHYSAIPHWDEWDGHVGFLDAIAAGDVGAWWRPHNEHCIVLARVLFWLDAACGERLIVPRVASVLVLGATTWLFVRCLRRQLQPGDGRARVVVAAVLVAALFSWVQWENLTMGFQVQVFLGQWLSLLALLQLADAAAAQRPRAAFVAAAVYGILSLGTMASGMTTLPVLAVTALVLRLGARAVIAFAVLSVAGVLFYRHALAATAIDPGRWLHAAGHPFRLLHFVCDFLGSPVCYLSRYGTRAAAASGLAYLVVLAVALWRSRARPRSPVAIALLAFSCNVVLAALAAGAGRSVLGPDAAIGSRYTTPALCGWCALLVACSPRLLPLAVRRPRSFACAAFVIVLPILAHQRYALRPDPEREHQRMVAVLALELGVRDVGRAGLLFPEPDRLRQWAEPARTAGRFVFGRPPLRGLREALGGPCPSSREVELLAPPTLLPLAGDAEHVAIECTLAATTDLPAVWLADERGRAVGFALVAVRDGAPPYARGYVLAARANGANVTLRAFAAK